MVLGIVSAANAASQQLRLNYITTKPLSSFSKAREADTSSKQARRKAKKVKRQTNKQQSGQQQAAPPQSAKLAGSEPTVEQQGVVPDEEPLLEADFPLPGSLKLPTLMGSPAALARLQPAPRSDAGGLGDATPLASSAHAGVPEAASPLAGKRRGPESVSGSESSEIAEAPSVDSLAMVPMTPGEPHAFSFFFFFFFFFWVTG